MVVTQDKDYGLGNFINLTPVINETGADVFFESTYVRQIYEHWDKIDVLTRPEKEDLSSSMINRLNTCPDYEYVYRRMIGEPKGIKTHAPDFKIAVIANGCANADKRDTKQPDNETYEYIIENLAKRKHITIFVGSDEDLQYSPFASKCNIIATGNPLLCALLIQRCDMVIMNDTGFYHLAGAYEKRGFILWKDTLRPKNLSPNPNFTYSTNHIDDFDKWLL